MDLTIGLIKLWRLGQNNDACPIADVDLQLTEVDYQLNFASIRGYNVQNAKTDDFDLTKFPASLVDFYQKKTL